MSCIGNFRADLVSRQSSHVELQAQELLGLCFSSKCLAVHCTHPLHSVGPCCYLVRLSLTASLQMTLMVIYCGVQLADGLNPSVEMCVD